MPEETPIRVAVLGAGIGAKHVQGLQDAAAGFEVTMVCDLDGERARALAAQAGDGCEFCTDYRHAIADQHVDVIDICLPGGSGIDLIRRSRQSGVGHRLVSTIFGDEATVVMALEAGADGYILKDNELVTDAIVEVARGHVPLTPSVAVHLVRRLQPRSTGDGVCLTPREAEILNCLARGRSYRETASDLSISYHTVTDHIKAIYKKLRVHSRSGAVYEGLRSGLITLGTDA